MAVWPPAPILASVAALERPEVPGLRWTSPDQWHVTVRFLGEADLEVARAAFRTVPVPALPVVAQLGPATGRFGRRVLQVPVRGLEALAAATVTATGGVGRPPDERPFAGHLTLARARPRGGIDLSGLTGARLDGRWTVRELTLVASRTVPGGARYEVVDTVNVGAPLPA